MGHLQCLHAEIVTDHQSSLIVILNVKLSDSSPPSITNANIVLGSTKVKATAQVASIGDGTTYLWGSFPNSRVKNGSEISLHAMASGSICDVLPIGVLYVAEHPIKTAPHLNDSLSSYEPPKLEDYRLPTLPSHEEVRILSGDETKEDSRRPTVSSNTYDILFQDYQRIELRTRDFSLATYGWTAAEIAAGRRLICFERSQNDTVVHLNFATHRLEQPYNDQSQLVISCIKWPDGHSGFFITSFDVLRLVEFILNLKMETEMKNRVRRNMASVPFITLPKGKKPSGSHPDPKKDPFTLIMSFDTHQPRSIEKSIKVYDWYDLKNCLAKILQRFVVAEPEERSKTLGVMFEHQLEAAKKLKRKKKRPIVVNGLKPWQTMIRIPSDIQPMYNSIESPAMTTSTSPKPHDSGCVRRTPLYKSHLKPIAPLGGGPNYAHEDHPNKLPNGPISSSSPNMNPYSWERQISRKASPIASSVDFPEDSSLPQSSAHSDSSDQTLFDTMLTPGGQLSVNVPPIHFGDSHTVENVDSGRSVFTSPPAQALHSQDYSTVPAKPVVEDNAIEWAQNTSPQLHQMDSMPTSIAPSNGNDNMPHLMPNVSDSSYVANGGYNEATSSNISSSWVIEYRFTNDANGPPTEGCNWEAADILRSEPIYNAMEGDLEAAARINADEWLDTDYIMSQESSETDMMSVMNGQRFTFH